MEIEKESEKNVLYEGPINLDLSSNCHIFPLAKAFTKLALTKGLK